MTPDSESDQFPIVPESVAAAPTDAERAYWQSPWTENEIEDLGLRTVTDGGKLFCGTRQEAFAINGRTYGWKPGSKITWGITFSRLGSLSDMDVKDAITAYCKEISDSCDLFFEYVSNGDLANIRLQRVRLDGASGVLADMQIPAPNASPANEQLRGRFDDGEGWVLSANPGQGEIDFYRVGLHEFLHACGLGHKPASVTGAALIAPTYSRTLRNLQLLDIAELQRRHGAAKTTPTEPAPPVQPGIGKPVLVTLEQEGRKWSGNIPRVK